MKTLTPSKPQYRKKGLTLKAPPARARRVVRPPEKTHVQTPRVHQPFDRRQMRWPEMAQYCFSDIHELRIFRWNLDQAEISAVESGQLNIRFEGEGALHYLVTEIELTHQCFRAPISWWLLPMRDCRLLQAGTQVRIVLVNGKSGVVEAVRETVFDTATETALFECLAHQAHEVSGHLEMDAQFKQDLQVV